MVKGPCILNIVQGGRTPLYDLHEAKRLGYRIVIMPGAIFIASLLAADACLKAVIKTGVSYLKAPEGVDLPGIYLRLGASEWNKIARRRCWHEAEFV